MTMIEAQDMMQASPARKKPTVAQMKDTNFTAEERTQRAMHTAQISQRGRVRGLSRRITLQSASDTDSI